MHVVIEERRLAGVTGFVKGVQKDAFVSLT
jgi:hypothetical protein